MKKEKGRIPETGTEPGNRVFLVAMRSFLEDELEDIEDSNFTRAFQPLTDGLGLEAPSKKPVPAPTYISAPPSQSAVPTIPKNVLDALEASTHKEPEIYDRELPLLTPDVLKKSKERLETEKAEIKPQRAKALFDPPSPTSQAAVSSEELPALSIPSIPDVPPPLPSASFFRRLQAGALDFTFVLLMWGITILITSHLYVEGSEPAFSRLLKSLGSSEFIRFIFLEYLSIWLAYFLLCLGLLDMTFGMWVWGLRVSYGEEVGKRFIRKTLRALMSFLFYAPVFPVFFLSLHRRNRTLLDLLTSTRLYRTAS